MALTLPLAVLLDDEDDAQSPPERRRILTEVAMGAIDELMGELRMANRALTCPRHSGKDRLPTLCPVCALMEVRLRRRGSL